MPPQPSAQAVANAQCPSNWTQEHDEFVKPLAENGESAATIVELVLAEYRELSSNDVAVAAWIWKRVSEM